MYGMQTFNIKLEPTYSPEESMRTQYLHVSAYLCERCKGPVISGSTGVRENEISKETEVQQVGAICLSCGHRQSKATGHGGTRDFPPVQWDVENAIDTEHLVSAYFEEINREELR
jgi:hypothetical protein